MVKVLISDKMSPRAAEVFKARGIEVDERPGLSMEELQKIIGKYEGLVVRSSTKVSDALIDKADKLKVVGRAGIGVDNIDIAAATGRGIVVMNTPFGNSITTAEHSIAMMMALARKIPLAHISMRAGEWRKNKFIGTELSGKTLGVIGCGNIGAIVADRAMGLKMKVMAYDPYLTAERAQDIGVKKAPFRKVLAEADFISLHTPLTDATRKIINKAAIKRMKDGAFLINCARGPLVDESALLAALESGKLAGAALDVYAKEPPTGNPLIDAPNVILTPHLGASTTEAQVKVAVHVAEQMSDYLLSGAVTNALNMPSVSAEEAPRLQPYLLLGEQIGSLAGQILEGAIRSVSIEYEGQVTEQNTRPLTAVILEGLLKHVLDNVNKVNATVVAKDRDISISEITHDREGAFQSLIRLAILTDSQTIAISGTLFSNGTPRIVAVSDLDIEATLEKNMLFVANEDKPGFIGALGTLLGESGINIGTFNLGRDDNGNALALISVDQPVPPNVIKKVAEISHVRQVKPLTF